MFLFFVLSGTPTSAIELAVLLTDGLSRLHAALEVAVALCRSVLRVFGLTRESFVSRHSRALAQAGLLLRAVSHEMVSSPAPLPRAARMLATRLSVLLTEIVDAFDESRPACRAVLQYCSGACQQLESPGEARSWAVHEATLF